MQLIAYLSFDGNCEEAFRYYQKHLGGEVKVLARFSDVPTSENSKSVIPPEWKDKIAHARLEIGGAVLMGGDPPPPYYQKPQGVSVNISLTDVAEAERIFNALADGGRITMPFAETFYAKRFGMCVDRFGTAWMVNCENPA